MKTWREFQHGLGGDYGDKGDKEPLSSPLNHHNHLNHQVEEFKNNCQAERRLPISWSAEHCRKRVSNLMTTSGDADKFWQEATAWYAKQSEHGETQEQHAAACWQALCTAWNELRGDEWANSKKAPPEGKQDIVDYALQLFDGELITAAPSATTISAGTSRPVDTWLALVRQAKNADEVFALWQQFRLYQWNREQSRTMNRYCFECLGHIYKEHHPGWLVDGIEATPAECIQVEKFLRGWHHPGVLKSSTLYSRKGVVAPSRTPPQVLTIEK